jgi:hypothetical protein
LMFCCTPSALRLSMGVVSVVFLTDGQGAHTPFFLERF